MEVFIVRNIVLIGFMGTGKTTAGRLLADTLSMPFVDTDEEIERSFGQPVFRILRVEGEWTFRRLEREVVHTLSDRTGSVIATGGGVVLNHDNLRDLERNGNLVLLEASPETIYERLKDGEPRPLVRGDQAVEMIRYLLDIRKAHYHWATTRVDTDGKTPEAVASEIVASLGR